MSSKPIVRSLADLERPPGHHLARALLTTYEPPSADLLLDDLLPRWLGMSRSAPAAGEEATYYAERHSLLRRTRGKIGIFHSFGTLLPHPWLWAFVRTLPLASEYRQHSKVWLFHWVKNTNKKEKGVLQVVVSSMNLTRDAVGNQLQAVWSATVPIESGAPRQSWRSSWGGLASLLEELPGAASKDFVDEARAHCDHFLGCLGRSQPPTGARFVASIPRPGAASPVEALRKALGGTHLTAIDILAPFVGPWQAKALGAFARRLLGKIKDDHPLRVIRQHHPKSGWYLSRSQCPEGLEPRVLTLATPLYDQQGEDDRRWVHAKVYQLTSKRQGKRRRHLLLTSANFTEAAWGNAADNSPPKKNFELGVVFEGRAFAFAPEHLEVCSFPELDVLVVRDDADGVIATWNGVKVAVAAKHFPSKLRVATDRRKVVTWTASASKEDVRRMPWLKTAKYGRPVELLWGSEATAGRCAIQWTGPALDVDDEPPMALELADGQRDELEAAILAERYGGPWVESLAGDRRPPVTLKSPKASGKLYSLAVIELARTLGDVVDGWQRQFLESSTDEQEPVREDGRRLVMLWSRLAQRPLQGGERAAYEMVADEIEARLRLERG